MSSQDIEPAFSRATIPDPDATTVWNLLKKAGFTFHISNTSDGTNGKAVLTGGTVRCMLDPSSATVQCGFDDGNE